MEPVQQETQPAEAAPPTQNGNTVDTEETGAQYKLPDAQTLQQVGELPIKDENGKQILFKSLYEDKPGRQLIVFIRHFYCGHCEEFVRFLVKNVPPSVLTTTTPPTTLTIIGCGEPTCIADYRTRTMASLGADAYPIYTDRDRAIYTALGMVVNLQMSEQGKPEYINGSLTGNVLSSVKNMFTSGAKGFQGGKYSQNGGEWIFEGGKMVWGRRMRNTQDHTTIVELRKVLGLKE